MLKANKLISNSYRKENTKHNRDNKKAKILEIKEKRSIKKKEMEDQMKYKIGNLYKRSKILKRWNKRSIVLDFIKGTLSMRKGTNSK